MFFSISVPIYNAARDLDFCISSIMNQTEQDFELILVDDGSKDNSVSICEKWKVKYPHKIRVVEKDNTGSLLTRRMCLSTITIILLIYTHFICWHFSFFNAANIYYTHWGLNITIFT